MVADVTWDRLVTVAMGGDRGQGTTAVAFVMAERIRWHLDGSGTEFLQQPRSWALIRPASADRPGSVRTAGTVEKHP